MKKCSTCGREMNDDDLYCPHCGTKQFEEEIETKEKIIPLKKRSTALLLAFFLGFIGMDDLYLKRMTAFYVKFGIAFVSMGLLLPILLIVGFVNFLIILFNKDYKDGLGRKLV